MARRKKHSSKRGRKQPSYEELQRLCGELQRLTGRQGQHIGAACESKVENAFTMTGVPPWYRGYRRGTHEEDALGMDCFILTDQGEFPIQIKAKNQRPGREKFIERSGMHIPIVYIDMRDSERSTRRKVLHVVAQERARKIKAKKSG